nr:MAG TPA: DNA-directed RNA polymerase II subunit [Caudoviricetes sp.]
MNDKLLGVILYIIFAIVIIAFIIYKVKTETPEKKKARQKELEAFKQRKEQKKQAQTVSNIITCPNCNSKNVSFLQQDKKAFSVGKAVGGAVLTGGIGALAGFAGKKGNKQWHCKNCGNFFETK